MNIEEVFSAAGGYSPYAKSVCRMVETQEYAATTSLVDDLEEQAILEQLLDEYKPSYAPATEDLHYLIATPFRYPPLAYGSRFGTVHEPSYFYASEDIHTCLSEAAFYRFYLIEGTQAPFPGVIQSQHSLFFVEVATPKALDLGKIKHAQLQQQLADPQSYATSQAVGKAARKQGVELIRYISARSQEKSFNVAIDNQGVIVSQVPENKTEYICQLDPKAGILRFSKPRTFPVTFEKQQFMQGEHFPQMG
ncbi:RES family NAD+ phosphorylase [Paraglaciecola aestuariivivens]